MNYKRPNQFYSRAKKKLLIIKLFILSSEEEEEEEEGKILTGTIIFHTISHASCKNMALKENNTINIQTITK